MLLSNDEFIASEVVSVDSETWKVLPSNDRYEVSDHGRVRVLKASPKRPDLQGKILCAKPDKFGYMVADVYRDGASKRRRLHRMVMEAFVGPCPEGQEIRHLDGIRTNNKLSNLRYGTRSENNYDAVRHGTRGGKPLSGSHRQALSVAHLGSTRSPAHRDNISKGLLAYNQQRKEIS